MNACEICNSPKDIKILGIETSCDETSAAVVLNGRNVLSNVIYSQIQIHRKYGGVVPEIASRSHLDKIDDIVAEALTVANVNPQDLDAVAVTVGPGLVGALLVGLSFGKAFAYALNKPLIGVHHIEGHICANYIGSPGLEPPFICLVASGGHTHIAYVKDYGQYEILGATRDDAAGEAFDKVARTLGLPYPGGVEIDKLAKTGDKHAIKFPRADFGPDSFDFSFSGLKSAVINYLHKLTPDEREHRKANIAASFQEAVVSVLLAKALAACRLKGAGVLALAGGVAANSCLREQMTAMCELEGITPVIPPLELCTDNAAMIASAGYFEFSQGRFSGLDQNAHPNLSMA